MESLVLRAGRDACTPGGDTIAPPKRERARAATEILRPQAGASRYAGEHPRADLVVRDPERV